MDRENSSTNNNSRIRELISRLDTEHRLSLSEYEEVLKNRTEEDEKFAQKLAIKWRKKIYGNGVYIRGLIEFTNYCKNNCHYCGIQSSNREVERYRLTKEDILSCIDRFYEEMVKRSLAMKEMENYKTGENYSYLGLPAHFLIFDEYVAFMEMLGTKENTAVLNKLKQIVMLGRQAGFFLILACQRPDAKYLGDGIRDQFHFRVALGRMSEMGYGMMFGSDVQKDFFSKQIKGRGYVDVGTSVISEFYTPLVPKGHDFLEEIRKLTDGRQDAQKACEA